MVGMNGTDCVPRECRNTLSCLSERTLEQEQPTIRITLDDQTAQGEYVNFANIIHSQSEFVLDLGRVVPGRNDVKIYSRVILTPLHAKQLLEALGHNLSLYEQKYGEVRGDAAAPYSQNEPSN